MRLLLILTCALAACGDDPETIVDLDFTEILPVQFGAMVANVPESATFDLPSYDTDPQFADIEGRVRCASIDAAASSLTATRLETAGGATLVSYEVRVGSASTTPVRLATFEGSLSEDESVRLDASGFSIDAAGLAALESVVQSSDPSLRIEVEASVPGAVGALDLELDLVVSMSTSAKRCP